MSEAISKAIVAREIDLGPEILTQFNLHEDWMWGNQYIHKQLVVQRDAGKAILLVLELEEVMNIRTHSRHL